MSLVTEMYEDDRYKGMYPYPIKKFGSRFGPKMRRCSRDVMKTLKGSKKSKTSHAIAICTRSMQKSGQNPKTAESISGIAKRVLKSFQPGRAVKLRMAKSLRRGGHAFRKKYVKHNEFQVQTGSPAASLARAYPHSYMSVSGESSNKRMSVHKYGKRNKFPVRTTGGKVIVP